MPVSPTSVLRLAAAVSVLPLSVRVQGADVQRRKEVPGLPGKKTPRRLVDCVVELLQSEEIVVHVGVIQDVEEIHLRVAAYLSVAGFGTCKLQAEA
jgi:hypothetical protein